MKNNKPIKRYLNFVAPDNATVNKLNTMFTLLRVHERHDNLIAADFELLHISPRKFQKMLSWDKQKRWTYLYKRVAKLGYKNNAKEIYEKGGIAWFEQNVKLHLENYTWADRVIVDLATEEGAKKEWEYYLKKTEMTSNKNIRKEYKKIKNYDDVELMEYTEDFKTIETKENSILEFDFETDEMKPADFLLYGYSCRDKRLEKIVKRRAIMLKAKHEANVHFRQKAMKRNLFVFARLLLLVSAIALGLATFAPSYFADKSEFLNTIYREYSAFYCPTTIAMAVGAFIFFIKLKNKGPIKPSKAVSLVSAKYRHLPFMMLRLEVLAYPVRGMKIYSGSLDATETEIVNTHYGISTLEGSGSPIDEYISYKVEVTQTEGSTVVHRYVNDYSYEFAILQDKLLDYYAQYKCSQMI